MEFSEIYLRIIWGILGFIVGKILFEISKLINSMRFLIQQQTRELKLENDAAEKYQKGK
jgi:hypothetical protein